MFRAPRRYSNSASRSSPILANSLTAERSAMAIGWTSIVTCWIVPVNDAGTGYSSLTGVARSSPTSARSSAEICWAGLSNPAFGDVRAIDRNPPESARAGLAAVIGELEANIAVSRWHRPLRHDVAALTAEPVVCEPRPPILQPKAPAAEPTSLCQNHARRARAWNVHIGRD